MEYPVRSFGSGILVLLLLLLPAPGVVAEQLKEVGRILAAVGRFTAKQENGATRVLSRRAPVFSGDLITTGEDGHGQIRFSDGSLIALQPSTQLRVDDFRFSGSADGSESAMFTLIKGGMRAITGVIGKKNTERYKVSSDVATIGIRGTHYLLLRCTSDCGGTGTGLYGGVIRGGIVVSNAAGSISIDKEQYFLVKSENASPQVLLLTPDILFKREVVTLEETNGQITGDEWDGIADEMPARALEPTSPISTGDPLLMPDTRLIDHSAPKDNSPTGAAW